MRRDMLSTRKGKSDVLGMGAPGSMLDAAEKANMLKRSPSWPPDVVDVADEMVRVARPKAVRKAFVVATVIFANNVAIFCLTCFLLREYLQIETLEAFGPGLVVLGSLQSDSIGVTVPEAQNAVFRSQSSNSALSVRAATNKEAMLVLGKTSGTPWELSNNANDQFLLRKGAQTLLKVDGASSTSTISTHLSTEANTVYGAPLVLSTGGAIPKTSCTTSAQCGAGQCMSTGYCDSGVVAQDILLAPNSAGSIRFNGPIEPVSGDLVLKAEQRIIVRKQQGVVGSAHLMLEDTHLTLLNPQGSSCVAACRGGTCPGGVANELACPGRNVLRTLSAAEAAADPYGEEGSLSLSDVIYVHPAAGAAGEKSVSVAGPIDVNNHAIVGAPLYLTARNGTNVTVEATDNGTIFLNSPLKMVGPIIPQNIAGSVPMVQIEGTLKVQNLQFELLDSETSRPDSDPRPGLICESCTPPPDCTATSCAEHSSCQDNPATAATEKCCTFPQHERHGWVRLTQDQAGQRYHLYFCTPTGWQEISPTAPPPPPPSGR